MRAILAVLTLAVALVGGAGPMPAEAATPDNQGPNCTDIKNKAEPAGYQTDGSGNAVFNFSFTLAAPPCTFATYTLHVVDNHGGTFTASYPGGGLTTCNPADPTQLCLTPAHNYGAASSAPTVLRVTADSTIGGHTADTTPTAEYVLDGPIGDNSWDQ